MAHTLILGEPGCTHEGDHDRLLLLLETAHACGCDVWKPQWTSNPIQMCERRHIGVDHPKRAYYERAYRWNSFPIDWHAEFRDRCHALGMQYAATCFLPQDVATVAPFVDYLKIASFEADDVALIREAINHKPAGAILVSSGMNARWPMANWAPLRLHCVSSYPSPVSALNLRVLRTIYGRDMGRRWHFKGLSDHSRHMLTGAIAVAAGARVIETHFRLDDCDPANPDYAVAFTPAEFAQYIRNIRDAEVMLGSGEKRVQDCERDMLPYRVTG